MKRAVILAGPDPRPPDLGPANDNDPPEPPPAASRRLPRMPHLLAAIAALGNSRTGTAPAQAA